MMILSQCAHVTSIIITCIFSQLLMSYVAVDINVLKSRFSQWSLAIVSRFQKNGT